MMATTFARNAICRYCLFAVIASYLQTHVPRWWKRQAKGKRRTENERLIAGPGASTEDVERLTFEIDTSLDICEDEWV